MPSKSTITILDENFLVVKIVALFHIVNSSSVVGSQFYLYPKNHCHLMIETYVEELHQ